MSQYDRRDPGTDPEYCDALAPDDVVEFDCSWCGDRSVMDGYWPYCSQFCADRAMLDSID